MMQTLKDTTRIGSIIAIILFAIFLAGNSIANKVEVEITSAIPLLDVAPPRIILQGQGFGSNPSVFMANAAGGEDELSIISANDGMIEAQLATTSPGTYTVWVVSEKPGNTPGRSDDIDVDIEVQVPVGAIIAWHKNLSPSVGLPVGWVECNGQVLDDAASPYHGQAIPNLNGQSMFLRGGATSGTMQEDTLASHDHDVDLTSGTEGSHNHDAATSIDATGEHNHNAETSISNAGDHAHSAGTTIASAGNHNHSASTNIASGGGHNHQLDIANPPLPGAGGLLTGIEIYGSYNYSNTSGTHSHSASTAVGANGNHAHSASTSIDAAGQHSHEASTSIDVNGNHSHEASTSIEVNGEHSHTVNGKTAAEGEAETRPVNMSVVWIMRVK